MKLICLMTLFFTVFSFEALACPSLDLIDKSGKTINSSCYRKSNNDEQTLVIVSASWCGPCKDLKKYLLKKRTEIKERKLSINYIYNDRWDKEKSTIKSQIKEAPYIQYFVSKNKTRRVLDIVKSDILELTQSELNTENYIFKGVFPEILVFEGEKLISGEIGYSQNSIDLLIEKAPKR